MTTYGKATPSTRDLQTAVHAMRRWVEALGRVGFAAKGIIYVLVGGLAAQAAAGAGGETTGSEGALRRIVQLPFGRFRLAAIALGLVGFAVWRFIQGYRDTENKGSGPKGLAVRAGYVVSGVIHLGLAGSALLLARGARQRMDRRRHSTGLHGCSRSPTGNGWSGPSAPSSSAWASSSFIRRTASSSAST